MISKRMAKELLSVFYGNAYGGFYGFSYNGKKGKIIEGQFGSKEELQAIGYKYIFDYRNRLLYVKQGRGRK